jgi:hypothetical protein
MRLEAHIALKRGHITGKFLEPVLNLDEGSPAYWENDQSRRAIAPLTVSAGDVFHAVSRDITMCHSRRVSPRPMTL